MGLISKIKSLFKKTLEVPANANERPVSVSNPNGVIRIGTKLTVAEDFVAVLCTKGKVCDTFIKGEYELTPGIMQKANRIRKLSIADKKGRFKKEFKGFIYFVNLKQFDDKFSSYNGVIVKERKLFTSYVNILGSLSYKIQNPKRFMEMLTMEYYNVSGELPNEKVRLLAGQYVDKFVQRKRLKFSYFYNNNPVVSEGLLKYMQKQFSTIGVELVDIKIDKYEFTRKLLKQIEKGKILVKDISTQQLEENEKESKLQNIIDEKQDEINYDAETLSQYENDVFSNENESQQENVLNNSDNNVENNSNNNQIKNNNQMTYTDFIKNNSDSNNENESQQIEGQDFDNGNITENNTNDFGFDSLNMDSTSDFDFDGGFGVENFDTQNEKDNDTQNFDCQDKEVEDEEDGVVTADVIKIKKCKKCGASNSGDSEKCFSCGASFKRVCSKCGNLLDDDEYVCSKCGSIVI